MVKRRSLVVYYKQDIVINNLKNVHVYYQSKKDNYAIIYTDQANFDELLKSLKSNPLVTDVKENEQVFEF